MGIVLPTFFMQRIALANRSFFGILVYWFRKSFQDKKLINGTLMNKLIHRNYYNPGTTHHAFFVFGLSVMKRPG
jgi:hypothetical protein